MGGRRETESVGKGEGGSREMEGDKGEGGRRKMEGEVRVEEGGGRWREG